MDLTEYFLKPTPDRWLPVQVGGFLVAAWLGAALALRRRLSPRASVGLNLLFLLAFFAAVEVASAVSLDRVAADSPTASMMVADPWRIWRPASNVSMEHDGWWILTNSLGLREDHELAVPPPEGETRVLCLGDSWTFGFGVDQRDTWPQQAERMLGTGVEMVNAGCLGYCTYQGYLTLLRPGLDLQPKAVVVHTFHNHGVLDFFRGLERREKGLGPLEAVLHRSAFYRWLRREYFLAHPTPTPPSDPGDTFEELALERLKAAADEAGLPLLFLDVVEEPGRESTLGRFGRAHGVPVVEVVIPLGSELTLPDDPSHPNAAGCRLIAEAAAEGLRKLGVAP